MTDTLRYLAEEIATDFADGFLSRREALRRLGLLGVEAAVASTMLVACSSDAPTDAEIPTADSGTTAPPAESAATPTQSAAPITAPAGTELVSFAGGEGRKLQGTWAAPSSPKGAVLVIHENRGFTEHFQAFPARLSKEGFAALAIDLLAPEGGTASLGDSANATAALGKIPPERFVADLRAGLDEMARRVGPSVKLGALGFCFGGAMTWRLIGAKDERLAAAAPFYGPMPEGTDFTGVKTAVLGVYAEKDARVNATRDAAKEALTKAGVPHEIVTFEGADHAFFNETGKRFDADAATKAWTKVLDWFGKYLA